MVRYSTSAAKALAFLKRFYNDIDIYIEDMASHNMTLLIIKRILGGNVKLASVNQLGGRLEVLKACKADQHEDGRKKLYIIDADSDLLLSKGKPRLKNLYRLRAYCVENLLLSRGAVLELATEADSNVPPHLLQIALDQEEWTRATTAALMPLFILYGVAQRLSPSVATTGFNVFHLCCQSGGRHALSPPKIRSRMRALMRQILAHSSLPAVRSARRELAGVAAKYSPAEYLLSGKDYLLPLLRLHLGAVVNFRGSLEELKVRLARHYEIAREPFLARRLRAVAAL